MQDGYLITDVGLDIDGVLYDFAGAFREYCQNRMNKDLPPATKWDFYHEWGMSDEQFQEWLADATKDMRLFLWNGPMNKVREGWDLLKSMDIKIHILTHRHSDAYSQTVTWLERYHLLPDGLHFGSNKSILKHIANGPCAALDDHVPFYDDYVKSNIPAFLLDQPWNRHKDAIRVSNLVEFARLIRIYNEYHTYFPKRPSNIIPYKSAFTVSPYTKTTPWNPNENTQTIHKYTTTN